MKRNKIPGTDIAVSEICLGSMTFGTPVGRKEAADLVYYALDKGINFIDTANMYEGYARVPGSSGGVAEEIIGEALKGRRTEAVLATKLGMKVGSGQEDEFTSPAAIRKQLDLSLKRLGTDYIDLYYLHKYDPATAPGEIVHEMAEAIKAGKIRSYGVSNYTAGQLEALLKAADGLNSPRPVICQPALSMLKTEALEDILPLCKRENIAVVPYQILQGGLLTGKYRRGFAAPAGSRGQEKSDWVWDMDDALYTKLEELEGKAAEKGLSMTSYAIRWTLEQPAVVSALVGVKRPAQIDDAILAASHE